MIMAFVAVVLIYAVWIYTINIRKNRKIWNDYLTSKLKLKAPLKSSALARKKTASLARYSG